MIKTPRPLGQTCSSFLLSLSAVWFCDEVRRVAAFNDQLVDVSVCTGCTESVFSAGCWGAVLAAESFADVPADGRQVSLRVQSARSLQHIPGTTTDNRPAVPESLQLRPGPHLLFQSHSSSGPVPKPHCSIMCFTLAHWPPVVKPTTLKHSRN